MINKLLFIILFFPVLALAEPQDKDLYNILNGLHTMQADFVQIVANDSGTMQQSSGNMALQRPGKFRWELLNPSKQVIVVNNSNVFIYDYDLNQISKQKIDRKQTSNPAILLSGSMKDLQDDFKINRLQKREKGDWFELTPRAKDSLFQKIQLQFIDNKLNAMYITDNLEQETTITFINVKVNEVLSDKVFTFVPPKGVDLI